MAEPETTIEGTLERIVFKGNDTAFTVARFQPTQGKLPVTVVGQLVEVAEGSPLKLNGQWVDDKKWGRQFKIVSYSYNQPKTLYGIEQYLGSGMIPGIGHAYAKRIVATFGVETLDVIQNAPHRLVEVPGIGTARAKEIANALAGQRHIEDVMVFLRGHGVSAAFAARIVKRYGKDAIQIVKANPYRLASDIWGIGFRSADAIAEKLGIARDAPERVEAGILHALQTANDDGHMHVPDAELIEATAQLLGIKHEAITPRLGALELGARIIRETLGDRGPCTSLLDAYEAEQKAAILLAAITETPARPMSLDVEAAIHAFEAVTGVTLAKQQHAAVRAALVDKAVVITGGPGVGKTTIVKAIVHLAKLTHRRVSLAAPTGRAAKRLGEATAHEATTIHRLLEYQPQAGGFMRNAEEPLEADLVVIDEASMVDARLFKSLLTAIRPGAQLVLVGDVDQLPSVGAGAVLHDCIECGALTVIRLTEIFRQAAESKIVLSAHRINKGELPDLEAAQGSTSDFYFISREEPEAARDTIVELVAQRIPARWGFDPITDVQVLSPMHRGETGTTGMNAALQARLNPAAGKTELTRGDRVYRLGDKVMQLKNDYERSVFNGDIGVISTINLEEHLVNVDFDGRVVPYERAELDQLTLAYAVSVHKSQGSEYPAVVIPLVTQHYMMLQRSLLYTGVTRGKKLVVLVGTRRAVELAVRNADTKRRYTWFAERVRTVLRTD
ncbi:MAG TPA: ATP-dependent RecD-like DNA helicase [Kofleriaceae bacterium]|jgi:exodeoxyribonuclease V alpha subunit